MKYWDWCYHVITPNIDASFYKTIGWRIFLSGFVLCVFVQASSVFTQLGVALYMMLGAALIFGSLSAVSQS